MKTLNKDKEEKKVTNIKRLMCRLMCTILIGTDDSHKNLISVCLGEDKVGLQIDDLSELLIKSDDIEGLTHNMDEILRTLMPREESVLRLHYGVMDERRPLIFEEIGREFGVSRERIRQIEAKALRKLKRPGYLDLLSEKYLTEEGLKVKHMIEADNEEKFKKYIEERTKNEDILDTEESDEDEIDLD